MRSTPTAASRAHSDLVERFFDPSMLFATGYVEGLRVSLSTSVPVIRASRQRDLNALEQEAATSIVTEFAKATVHQTATCRTYLIDSSLIPSIHAHLDELDPNAERYAPPAPQGFLWFGTPLLMPHANGMTQRVDAMSWCWIEIGDSEAVPTDDVPEPVLRRYVLNWWTHTGDGRGEDELTAWAIEKHREWGSKPKWTGMDPWRIATVNYIHETGPNGPARMEYSDEALDELIEHGQDLVNVEAPKLSAMCSAIWGVLTGKLTALDGGGERDLVVRDEEPNRAATKRARRGKRCPSVHAVSMGARREGSGTPETLRGTRGPIGVQYYVPGFWRRPRGSARDAQRTEWVSGHWCGHPDAPISEHSTVYVARSPRRTP